MKAKIRVHLSAVAGSDEKVIERIEQFLKDNSPFGLKCQRSTVIFIPHQFKAYWIWSDGETGPEFNYGNTTDFITGLKMQYLSHKELVTPDELLGVAQLLKHAKERKRLSELHEQNRRLGLLRSQILPESGQQTGPLENGRDGISESGVN